MAAALKVAKPSVIQPSTPSRASRNPPARITPLGVFFRAPAVRLGPTQARTPSGVLALGESGVPLMSDVRERLERSFGQPLDSVRVHNDQKAAAAAGALGARAFAYGSHIYLGPSQSQTDIGLMAHEAAHSIQQQGSSRLQSWTVVSNDRYEREAHQASSAVESHQTFPIHERTGGSLVQRWGLPNPLDILADKANNLPGFRMFTIILGVNPINMSRVERSAGNILRALIEFIPGGKLITDAMENHGIFDKIGNWISEQLKSLGLSASIIKDAVTKFIKSLSASDIFHPGDVWERAKRIFTEPITRIINFVKGLVSGIITFIKDAILRPLAELASKTRGYDLLRAILGKDPVTGEPYPRTAETLIGGFMKLIGQEEIWENIKKAKALPRAWAWFQGAMKELTGFVQQIPSLFIAALKSLELLDIVLVPRAFLKVAKVFGGFVIDFITWGGNAVWKLLQIIFEVVAPGVVPYLKNVGAAFKLILKNPIGFVKNLVKAGMQGFNLFAKNIGKHLKTGIIDWLTGSLPGVYIPASFEFREIVKFVLSVLGLTWQNIRLKLVNAMGETAVKALETGFELVVILVRDGPGALWEKIKEQLGNLKEMAIQAIMDFVITTVVGKAVAKIVSMFIPGAGFISAILSIYDTIMVFIAKLQKIIQVVKTFLDSIVSIANGVIGAAVTKVESTLAGLLTLAINFLAGFVGLGKVADKIMDILNKKVRAPIDKALDKIVGWIVGVAKKVAGKVKAGVKKLLDWWKMRKEFKAADGQNHSLSFSGKAKNANLFVASNNPQKISDFIANNISDNDAKKSAQSKLKEIEKLIAAIDTLPDSDDKKEKVSSLENRLGELSQILKPFFKIVPVFEPIFGSLKNGFGNSVTVAFLSNKSKDLGSSPRDDFPGNWEYLGKRAYRKGSKSHYYIKGHLLNQKLGGTGKKWENLTPLTQTANNWAKDSHLKSFEKYVKEEVNKNKTGKIANVIVVANYGRTKNDSLYELFITLGKNAQNPAKKEEYDTKAKIVNAEQYVPISLTCRAKEVNTDGKIVGDIAAPPPIKVEIDNTKVEDYTLI